MISSNRKQNSKTRGLKDSSVPGRNCSSKAKTMSPIAKLMATFYGIEQK